MGIVSWPVLTHEEVMAYMPPEIRFTEYTKIVSGWYHYKRKDGTPGALHPRTEAYYTPLHACDCCGKLSTPKKVSERSDCYSCEFMEVDMPMLCTGCWNKIRPLYRRLKEISELRKLARKLGAKYG